MKRTDLVQNCVRTVLPNGEPVTVDECKASQFLRLTADDGAEATVELAIKVCRQAAEDRTGATLLLSTWQLTRSRFPDDHRDPIRLPHPPVIAVSSIKYQDANNVQQTLDPSLYVVSMLNQPRAKALVRPAYLQRWPDTYETDNCVVITYTAGWTTKDKVPDGLRQWIIARVGWLYDTGIGGPDSTRQNLIPEGDFVDGLLDQHRVWRL